MSNDRSMRTIGIESYIVFTGDNGDVLLPYPRFRQSSNGFVRGPHNEQLARGDEGLGQAKEAVNREIQAMLDRQARLGRSPLGCTSCFTGFPEMPKNRHEPNDRSGVFQVKLRGYWNLEHEDCFDEILFVFRMRAGYMSERTVRVSPLRTLPFEDFVDGGNVNRYTTEPHSDVNSETGELQFYSQSGLARAVRREFRHNVNTTTRQSVDLCWNSFKEVLESVQTNYLTWECDTDLEALETLVQGYLDASSIGRLLNPVAAPFAEAMQAAGFHATWHFNEATEDFRLDIRLDEHTIRLTNSNDPTIICHFARDEERLHALRALRLEQELIDSRNFLKEHPEQQ